MATGSYDTTSTVWNLEKGYEIINKIHGHAHAINCIAFSINNKYFATASSDNSFKIWRSDKDFDLIKSI